MVFMESRVVVADTNRVPGEAIRRWSPMIALAFLIGITCMPMPAAPFAAPQTGEEDTSAHDGECAADVAANEAVLRFRGEHRPASVCAAALRPWRR